MHWKWTTTQGTVVWLYLVEIYCIMCAVESSHVLAAAANSELSSTVSCGQVKSKDMPFSDDWYNAFVMVVNK